MAENATPTQQDAPQSGPAMLRHALERVLAASQSGQLTGLYGPLLAYIERALEQPETQDQLTTVPVEYWDSVKYNPNGNQPTGQYEMQIADQRVRNGQVYLDITATNGNPDDMLSATAEISRLPGSEQDVPCVHLHFDGDNLCGSFFKESNRIVMRLETDVTVRDHVLATGERAFILE